MPKTISLSIISPDRVILQVDDITMVRIGLCDGTLLSVYSGHAPLLAEIRDGVIEYIRNAHHNELLLSAGILQVTKQDITVFVNKVSDSEDIKSGSGDADIARFEKLSSMLQEALLVHPVTAQPE